MLRAPPISLMAPVMLSSGAVPAATVIVGLAPSRTGAEIVAGPAADDVAWMSPPRASTPGPGPLIVPPIMFTEPAVSVPLGASVTVPSCITTAFETARFAPSTLPPLTVRLLAESLWF